MSSNVVVTNGKIVPDEIHPLRGQAKSGSGNRNTVERSALSVGVGQFYQGWELPVEAVDAGRSHTQGFL
jgi:hypothetical protein